MKYLPKISFILYLLCIPMCVGEAIPDNEDRLYFSINNYSEVIATETPPADTPYVAPPPKATPPEDKPYVAPPPKATPPADKLGLVPISGIQVNGVTEELLAKVIAEYTKLRGWYDEEIKKNLERFTCNSEGEIYKDGEKYGIHFYDSKKNGKELANTFGVRITVTIKEKEYNFACSETPFQAAKINLLLGTEHAETFIHQLQNATGGDIQQGVAPLIKSIATTAGKTVNAQFYKPWDDSSVWVMINIVLGKALQNPNQPMIQLLKMNREFLIVEHTGNDDKWGDGSKLDSSILGPGENKLGLIWMAVRNIVNQI